MIKQKKNKFQLFRFAVQIIFFILAPIVFSLALSGVKSLVLVIKSGNFESLTSMMAASIGIILFTTIFGRFFCGWACAFGTYNDIIHIIGKRFVKIKNTSIEKYDKYFKLIKYLYIIAIIILCFLDKSSILNGKSSWDAFGQVVTLRFRFATCLFGVFSLVLVTIGAFFIERFFCRYLCPMGAIFSIVTKLNIIKISKKKEKCGKCRICTNSCAMGIPMYKDDIVNSGECIKCFKCVDDCPRGNVKVIMLKKEVNKYVISIIVIAFLAVLYFSLGLFK